MVLWFLPVPPNICDDSVAEALRLYTCVCLVWVPWNVLSRCRYNSLLLGVQEDC
jgi:hypothetical protein